VAFQSRGCRRDGWWEDCWPVNRNVNLQHSENLSAV
jgi:hypothetical protein